MPKKIRLFTAIVCFVLFCGLTLAQEPVVNIDPHRHPNLREAQEFMVKANGCIALAQKDNRYDMRGHASKARSLLLEASQELKLAAEDANAADAQRDKHH